MDVSTGTSYTYTRDHLGSVRELLNPAGQVVSRFDYDPWGQRSWISGTVDSSFGYAGYFRHAASGLDLTLFRAYDPELGRWLSRDPIFEGGGSNLYGYVGNSPGNHMEPSGLSQRDVELIRQTTHEFMDELVRKGGRLPEGGWTNNWERVKFKATFGTFGRRYLGCGSQWLLLKERLERLELDDKWKFDAAVCVPIGPLPIQVFGYGFSMNPPDPDLEIDPFRGEHGTVTDVTDELWWWYHF